MKKNKKSFLWNTVYNCSVIQVTRISINTTRTLDCRWTKCYFWFPHKLIMTYCMGRLEISQPGADLFCGHPPDFRLGAESWHAAWLLLSCSGNVHTNFNFFTFFSRPYL